MWWKPGPSLAARPRGKTPEEDLRLEESLLADEKELAEHVMLVDLARNDLGRVCEYGTVKVDHFKRIERYSHVMHIVSDVTGRFKRLRPPMTPSNPASRLEPFRARPRSGPWRSSRNWNLPGVASTAGR